MNHASKDAELTTSTTSPTSGSLTHTVLRHESQQSRWIQESLVVERPLHITVNRQPLMTTMRTPGHDAELVSGYLVHEGVIQRPTQIINFTLLHNTRADTGCIFVRDIDEKSLHALRRAGPSVSSCGICGRAGEAPFEPRVPQPVQGFSLSLEEIAPLLALTQQNQPLFAATGGIHAAAIFDANHELLCVREDIGRHNAIDKTTGWLLEQQRLWNQPLALFSSGRASFEVLQKAAMAGIGTVVSVSAASSMAVEVARAAKIRLIGFVRPHKAIVYWDPDWPVETSRGANPLDSPA